jgi:hypothetical protein
MSTRGKDSEPETQDLEVLNTLRLAKLALRYQPIEKDETTFFSFERDTSKLTSGLFFDFSDGTIHEGMVVPLRNGGCETFLKTDGVQYWSRDKAVDLNRPKRVGMIQDAIEALYQHNHLKRIGRESDIGFNRQVTSSGQTSAYYILPLFEVDPIINFKD